MALPEMPVRPTSAALVDTGSTRLGRTVSAMAASHPGLAGTVALADGREAFGARVLLAQAADASIDTQTYIWHADATGWLMFDAVRHAADRGVRGRVRVLLDDNTLLAGALSLALDAAWPARAYKLTLGAQGQLHWQGSAAEVFTREPETGVLRRAGVSVMTWLPIKWLL